MEGQFRRNQRLRVYSNIIFLFNQKDEIKNFYNEQQAKQTEVANKKVYEQLRINFNWEGLPKEGAKGATPSQENKKEISGEKEKEKEKEKQKEPKEKVEEQKVEKNVAEENLTKPHVEVDPNAKH